MVLVLLTCFSCKNAEESNNASPNFIVILTDDQRRVGTSYLTDPDDPRSKSDYYETPNMAKLAEMGMRFTNGYSRAPFCCPTRKSITIGQTPDTSLYTDWRFNNVQAVTNAYGTSVDGLLMFYGWKDKDAPAARAFLVLEGTRERYLDQVFNDVEIQEDIVFGGSINYRVRANPKEDPSGTMGDALEDAMKGLNWLRENSKDLGVDKSRIVVGGGSAGGMIAVNLCYKNEGDAPQRRMDIFAVNIARFLYELITE